MSQETGTARVKRGMAEMLKGGVIMDVVNAEQAKIAEDAGAVAVMALERVPADIRAQGGVARMSDPDMIEKIQATVSIPVMANRAQLSAFISGLYAVRCVFDYQEFMPFRNGHDDVHLAPHTGIVDRNDGFCAGRDGGFDEFFVDVQRVGSYVDKDGNSPTENKGIGGRDKCVGGHDDFVAWPDIRQDCRHF